MKDPALAPMTNATFNATAQSGALPPLPGAKLGLTVLSLAFILGFPGNVFVVWSALWRVQKRTITCLLILHLALADCAVLLTSPFFLRLLSAGQWEFGSVVCQLCYYVCGVSMYASISLITLMSLDRCLAVTKPVIAQKIRTAMVVRSLVLAIWMVSFLLAVPVIFYRKLVLRGRHLLCDLSHPTIGHLVFHNLFETLTGFVLPFAAIIWSYCVIGHRLQDTRFRRKRRTNRLIVLIVAAFALFWLPFHVVNILDVAGALSHSKGLIMAGKMARPTLTALAFFSSSVNPILYAFSGAALIKSAGIGFMAKLFEGTASEMSSTRQGTGQTTQRREKAKLEMVQDGNPERITLATNPLE
ncbi:leukotriene B4 receptor 1-like isoform X4 [Mauremys reevesii]|uniref:leukotriene B4 receptor 1-like isoform X4 n=1 Tax=Mauremys reevesii TaxID=260615 RepID=UPI00193F47AD|nr:leukotriene B4 receptor 1-like isoform X4 [Mauremys reevesii]